MPNLKKSPDRQIIYKVHPVGSQKDATTLPNPDVASEWQFGGKAWKNPGEDGELKVPVDEARKVLLVRYAGSKKFPNNGHGRFLIDVPKHFFNTDGEFTARPLYKTTDILHVLWTGTESPEQSGWIDLNYQERGGGGGGTTTTVNECTKWS